MYNDTIANSGQGVHINSSPGDDQPGDSGYQAVILNNTFYNDPFAHPDDRAAIRRTRTAKQPSAFWR